MGSGQAAIGPDVLAPWRPHSHRYLDRGILDAHSSRLDAGAHSPELLCVYLGALGVDFHIDPDQAPELTRAVGTLADRYAAAAADRRVPQPRPAAAWEAAQ